jgi:hypothetical protein
MAIQYFGEKVSLADCPVGLFEWHGLLALKTKYFRLDGGIDAFVLSTGEFFYGDAVLSEEQIAIMVRPVLKIETDD